MKRVLDAACGGEITPGDGNRLARRARTALRPLRRLMWREIAALKASRPRQRNGFPDKARECPCSQEIRP
jgi:hypothetical protein